MRLATDLLIRILPGQDQHNISCFHLQLVSIGGSIVMYGFDLNFLLLLTSHTAILLPDLRYTDHNNQDPLLAEY